MVEPSLTRIAEKFWRSVGQQHPVFPQDIESAVAWALPVAILRMPNLWVNDVEECFRQRQLPVPVGTANRALHGCICAYGGKGLIIVNGTNNAAEIRLTIAHEVAHFLLDYLQPRERALDRLGATVGPVLDGLRRPTAEERIDSLLVDAPVGLYTHFMHRNGRGEPDQAVLGF